MKLTPFNQKHLDLGAKMADFAGFDMPISYGSIQEEHQAVRKAAGIFDVSHMGEFHLSGPQAMDLLQWVTTNDVSKLEPGRAQYNCLPNENAGIVDDLLIYCLTKNDYLLVVNAANIQKDFDWIKSQGEKFDCLLQDKSDRYALLAVQGPKATEILQKLTPHNLSGISYYHFAHDSFAGLDEVLISATGYTGSGGFELYLPVDGAASAWDKILEAGKSEGLQPVGLAARDTLRLEMGYCLYGNDINDETTPLEGSLGWITKLNTEFVSVEKLRQQKEDGIKKRLIGFEMSERGIPRKGYEILNAEGKVIGQVTSGTMSPSLGKGIGLGYVRSKYRKSGTEIKIGIRKKQVSAQVVKLPFYKK